jgi:thiol-disulfide isomerase/thioredoxin
VRGLNQRERSIAAKGRRDHVGLSRFLAIRKGRKAALASAFLLVALIATTCGGSAEPAAGAALVTDGINLGVPDLTISIYQGDAALGGDEVTLTAILEHTGKPLVLNFWAGLCPPCRAEMPGFQEVFEARGDEFTLLGVDIGPFQLLGTRAEGLALIRELGVGYPAGTTFDERAIRSYQLLGMPTTYFITKDGVVKSRFAGLLTESKMNELIDEIL